MCAPTWTASAKFYADKRGLRPDRFSVPRLREEDQGDEGEDDERTPPDPASDVA